MPIYDSVIDTVGRTPLIRLSRVGAACGADILGKMESRNPCSSVKDRLGVALIRDAERRGALEPGGTIVEATSGNTGIGIAFVCAALGYKLIMLGVFVENDADVEFRPIPPPWHDDATLYRKLKEYRIADDKS